MKSLKLWSILSPWHCSVEDGVFARTNRREGKAGGNVSYAEGPIRRQTEQQGGSPAVPGFQI